MSFSGKNNSSSQSASNSSKVTSSRWRDLSTPLERQAGSIGSTFSTISNKQPQTSSISKQNEESLLQSVEKPLSQIPQKVFLDGDDTSMIDNSPDVSLRFVNQITL